MRNRDPESSRLSTSIRPLCLSVIERAMDYRGLAKDSWPFGSNSTRAMIIVTLSYLRSSRSRKALSYLEGIFLSKPFRRRPVASVGNK
jgi:hypothetical protein